MNGEARQGESRSERGSSGGEGGLGHVIKIIKQIITIIVINRILKIKKIHFPRNNNQIIINTNFNSNVDNNENSESSEPEEPVSNHVGDFDKFALNADMRTKEEINFTLSIMDDLNVDKVRIWENWALREPSLGQYDWSGLDMRINSFKEAGKKIILTIKPTGITGGKINWYCQEDTVSASGDSCLFKSKYEDDFANYIKSILDRYPGQIDEIQFHNEWESYYHFEGTGLDYTKYANILYYTVKQNSPQTIVALGSITKSALVYIAGCDLDILPEFYDHTGRLISDNERQIWCESTDTVSMKERVAYVFANAKYDRG